MIDWEIDYKPLYPGSNWDKEETWILDGYDKARNIRYRCPFPQGIEPTNEQLDKAMSNFTSEVR